MAAVLVVEKSVANNSSSQDSNHSDNHFQSRCVTTLLNILFEHIHFTTVLSRFPSRSKQFINFPFKNISIWTQTTFLGPVFSNYFRIVKKIHELEFSYMFSWFRGFKAWIPDCSFIFKDQPILRVPAKRISKKEHGVFWVVIKPSFSLKEYFVDYKVPTCWNALLGLNFVSYLTPGKCFSTWSIRRMTCSQAFKMSITNE